MIPKKIHYCWFGGAKKTKLEKKCIKSWKKKCSDYEIIEWNESNYDVTKIPYIKEAYEAKKWGFVTDYIRLDIIYNYGGLYFDTDVEVIKSFNSLLKFKGFAGFEDDSYVATGLGFGAEKGNCVIKAIMDSYKDVHFLKPDGTYDLTPCPISNSKVLGELGFAMNGKYQEVDGFVLLPTEYLCPLNFISGQCIKGAESTFSIHHYAASWYSDEEQKSKERRWKINRKVSRKDAIKYFPHRVFIKIFGREKFDKLKNKFK